MLSDPHTQIEKVILNFLNEINGSNGNCFIAKLEVEYGHRLGHSLWRLLFGALVCWLLVRMGQSNLSREGIWESQWCHQYLTVRSKRRNCVLGIVPETSASRIPCQPGTTQSKTSLDYQGESVSQNQKTSRAKRKERTLASQEEREAPGKQRWQPRDRIFVKGWAHSSCWDDHRWGNGSRSSDNPKEGSMGLGTQQPSTTHKEGKQDVSMQSAALYQVPTVCHSCCVPGSVAESHTDTLPRWTDHRAQALIHNGPLPTGLLNPGTNGHIGSS